ncbi:MAG: lipopolysaccharide kinase InaA family protein [Verrucomicrobia subdivision 3 bacterium]|nr:lipopolysaccharide kinase InaA family protein [Limisphaerales bacterium]
MLQWTTTIKGGLRWWVRPDADAPGVHQILKDPDSFLADPAMHLKNYDLVTMSRVPSKSDAEPSLVLRRLNYGRLRHRLRDVLRASRARRAFIISLRMEQRGIRTPRALAVAEVRRMRWPVKAYLITEEVPLAVNLGEHLLGKKFIHRRIIQHVAELIARLHDAGFSHRDLKYTNILVDAKLEPWVIDLDGVRNLGRVPARRAVADLAVLARNFREYPNRLRWEGARFLKHYCRQRGLEDRFREFAVGILAEMRRL